MWWSWSEYKYVLVVLDMYPVSLTKVLYSRFLMCCMATIMLEFIFLSVHRIVRVACVHSSITRVCWGTLHSCACIHMYVRTCVHSYEAQSWALHMVCMYMLNMEGRKNILVADRGHGSTVTKVSYRFWLNLHIKIFAFSLRIILDPPVAG